MKPAAGSIDDFVKEGMAAIETTFSQPRDKLQAIITVPNSVYENLLRNVFKGIPLFTGKTNGQDRPIHYDPISKLLFSKEDGRLLIPMKLIEEQLKQDHSRPVSNLGAELSRLAKAGINEGPAFKYDETGKYIGMEINGKIVAPEDIHKPYDSKTCVICQKPSTSKCSACKGVNYCGPQCQRLDWPSHKSECLKIKQTLELMKLNNVVIGP